MVTPRGLFVRPRMHRPPLLSLRVLLYPYAGICRHWRRIMPKRAGRCIGLSLEPNGIHSRDREAPHMRVEPMKEQHPEIAIYHSCGRVDGVLVTHGDGECLLAHCALHNPSRHPLASAPLRWRSDIQILERVCPHGIGHPDPDSMDSVNALYGEMTAGTFSVHSCDGCCGSIPPGGVLVE